MLISWFRAAGQKEALAGAAPISVGAERGRIRLPPDGRTTRRRFIEIGLTAAAFGMLFAVTAFPVRARRHRPDRLPEIRDAGPPQDARACSRRSWSRSASTVEWTEFPAGPQLLEALNVGAIDYRHHRRGAADLRAGRRRAARLCRLRAAGAGRRGDPRSAGQPAPDGRRPEGQERRAEQGLERPLSARQGAGEGGRRLLRHQDRRSCRRPMRAPPSRRARSTPG